MASHAECLAAIDSVAAQIATEAKNYAFHKERIEEIAARLAAIPSTNADVVSTINGYTPTGAVEIYLDDALAKLTADYQALRNKIIALTGQPEWSA